MDFVILFDANLANSFSAFHAHHADCVKDFGKVFQVNQREVVELSRHLMEKHAVCSIVFMENHQTILKLKEKQNKEMLKQKIDQNENKNCFIQQTQKMCKLTVRLIRATDAASEIPL